MVKKTLSSFRQALRNHPKIAIEWERDPEKEAQNPQKMIGRYTVFGCPAQINYKRLSEKLKEIGDPNFDKPIFDFRHHTAQAKLLGEEANTDSLKKLAFDHFVELNLQAEEDLKQFIKFRYKYNAVGLTHDRGFERPAYPNAILVIPASRNSTITSLIAQSRALGITLIIALNEDEDLTDYQVVKDFSLGNIAAQDICIK